MKRIYATTAIVFLTASPTLADNYAIVDYDGDGIIDATDYIGPKSTIAEAVARAEPASAAVYEWRETTETVTTPRHSTVTPISELALPEGFDTSKYIDTGPYQGGQMGTLEMQPASTSTATKRERVLVQPAQPSGLTAATVYGSPHGGVERTMPTALMDREIYTPQKGADGVITRSEMGAANDLYADNRLARYDTNVDGVVTVKEASSHLDPLMDPNQAASSRSDYGDNYEPLRPQLQ